jgi:glutamate-1-semialdehyde 2,1-aminomutase
VLPAPGFLDDLRAVTREFGALLVIDEVMTGFRVSPNGAIGEYGIDADLVTFGKVVGGGFPLAAYAGKREIMEHVAPAGSMYQAGTLSGNPVATAAGIATLEILGREGVWDRAAGAAERLANGLAATAQAAGVPVQVSRAGTMLGMFFSDKPVKNYDDAKLADTDRYRTVFQGLLDGGVYFAPSQFETLFTSTVHSDEDIAHTIAAFEQVLQGLV